MNFKKNFLRRLIESSGIFFAALMVLAAVAYALTTWSPGSAPAASPGDGNVEVGFGGWSNIQVFTSSGTFTVPNGVTKIFVEAWGGGGGSGGANTTYIDRRASGGGGGGAYSAKIISVTAGDQINYIVGTGGEGGPIDNYNQGATSGGDTKFGNYLTAGGGTYGTTNGGAGGTASNGDINITGHPGINGETFQIYSGSIKTFPGFGGSSPRGGGSATLKNQEGLVPGGGAKGVYGKSEGLDGARGEIHVWY